MSIKKLSFTAVILTGSILASSVINSAYAKNIAIYRWLDENNVVHFSQNLPQGDKYTELSTVSSFKALSKTERKTLSDAKNATQAIDDKEQARDDTTAKNKAMYEKNCKTAKLNIKMLNSLDDVLVNEEKKDGTIGSRSLTTAEKQEKLALSKKHQGIYCDK